MRRRLQTQVISRTEEFAALENEWWDLYRSSPRATPFQSWEWLYSWWEFYGGGKRLLLILVRDERGTLAGLAPFMVARERGVLALRFVGSGITEYLDILARREYEAEVVAEVRRALEGTSGWHVADLQQIRPAALLWGLSDGWGRFKASVRHDSCPVLEVKSEEETLTALSRNLRSTLRRSIRKAERDGVTYSTAEQERTSASARRFIELHRQMWEGRPLAPEHRTARFENHLTAAAARMSARDLAGIRELTRDGEVIASSFLVFGQDCVGYYLSGATKETLARYQLSSLQVWDFVNVAREKGASRFDFLRGEEEYKLRWKPYVEHNHRVVLGKNPLVWAAYAAFYALHSKARQYANSEDAPAWVKKAKSVYRSVRANLPAR